MLDSWPATFLARERRINRSRYHQCQSHLDQLLSTLRQDELPMTLCEFNGFATGLLVCPDDIEISEWLPEVWGMRGVDPFPDQRSAM